MTEGERLAKFSELVRESSLKRFKKVAPEDWCWRPIPNQLSFVDLLKHLIDADNWIMAILKNDKNIPRAVIRPGDAKPEDCHQFLSKFEILGKTKAELLRTITDAEWSHEVEDWEKMGKITKWLILVRGNLDHEIHHRGSLQTMLNLKYK